MPRWKLNPMDDVPMTEGMSARSIVMFICLGILLVIVLGIAKQWLP